MMRLTHASITLALAGAAALSASCARNELTGPPELKLGRAECAECGMLVSEDRASAATLVERAGNERLYLFFDDIGCMLDRERDEAKAAEEKVLERYVHDYNTRAWIDAGEATFVLAPADRIETPMGSGIVAFADRAAAQTAGAAAGDHELADFPGIAALRRDWMIERYGTPGQPAAREASHSSTSESKPCCPHHKPLADQQAASPTP